MVIMNHARPNDIVSGILHAIGAVCGVALLPQFIVYASLRATTWLYPFSFAVFGVGIVVLYVSSSVYHLIPHHRITKKQWWQRVDHASIFVLIASTYTPIALLWVPSTLGWTLFGVEWGLALIGITSKMTRRTLPMWMMVPLYLFMGWLLLFAVVPIVHSFTVTQLVLLFTGGGVYTLGVLFFLLDKVMRPLPYVGMHELFHLFVLAGTTCHVVLLLLLLFG